MADFYDIRLYDNNGVQQTSLQKWGRLSFTQRLNGVWNHAIYLNLSSSDDLGFFLRDEVGLNPDWQVRIIRYNPLNPSESDVVYTGFNRTVTEQATTSGNIGFALYGSDYTDLIRRRISLPPEGEETADKTGPAETILKAFVDENCVSAVDTDRNFPGLSIEADSGLGLTATYSARYTQLFTVVSRIAEQGGIFFGIQEVLDNQGLLIPRTFELKVRQLWGIDRRQGNTEGNQPTIFDMYNANMAIPIFSQNYSDIRNAVYAGGAGQGVDRLIQFNQDDVDVARSPWNRFEGFLNASQETTADGLQTRIAAELFKGVAVPTLNFTLHETEGTQWLRDWTLGDLVTARYFDRQFDKLIREVTVDVTGGAGERREVVSMVTEQI